MKIISTNYKTLILILSLVLAASACKDTDDDVRIINNEGMEFGGTLALEFDNVVADQNLVLTDQTYTNKTREDYEITELKYIISNITLTQSDGTVFTYPVADSYFVIDEGEPRSLQINLTDIPQGRYSTLNFGFGVDQTNYPIEQGSLNFIPTAKEKGMLWAWAAGYKFLKMEGSFRSNGSDIAELFTYHIGSLSNTLDNYKEISLSLFTENAPSETPINTLTITSDIASVFDASNTISLEANQDIQIDPENSPKIAENISTMFSIKQ